MTGTVAGPDRFRTQFQRRNFYGRKLMKRLILLALAGLLTLVVIGCDQQTAAPASDSGKGSSGAKLPPGAQGNANGDMPKTATPE